MNEPIVTEQRLEAAMHFLASSDDTYAQQKADLENSEILRKRVRARVFLAADGTVAERTAEAEVSDDAQAADDAYVAALKEFELTRARRQRAELVIDVYRTISANMRRT